MTNKKKHLNKYVYPDEYIMLELETKLKLGETSEKIRYLNKIKKLVGYIPDYIIEKLSDNKDDLIRLWLVENINSHVDKKIEKKLLNDKNSLIKAKVHESKYFGGLLGPNKDFFKKTDKINKLALMRRGNLPSSLVEKIFDYNDKELKISIEEKADLIKAYLTNVEEIDDSRKDFLDHVDGMDYAFTSYRYSKLWDLISEWSDDYFEIKRLTYIFIGNDSKNKVNIYKKSDNDLKLAIVEGCTGNESHDNDIFKLAKKEKDDWIKKEAYSKLKYNQLEKNELEDILKSENKEAISGIAHNKNIPLDKRWKACNRLGELNDDLEVFWLRKELDKEEQNQEINDDYNFDYKTNNKKGSIIGYVWTIIINLIELGVIIALFNAYSLSNFEIKILAILVILYLSIEGFLIQYGQTTANTTLAFAHEFIKIKKLLKSKPDEYEVEELKNANNNLKLSTKKMYIKLVFLMLAYLVALINLFGAL